MPEPIDLASDCIIDDAPGVTRRTQITDEFSQIARDVNRTYYADRFGAEHRLACSAVADWLEESGSEHPAALDALRSTPCRLAWSRTNGTVQITAPAHPKATGRKNTVRYKVIIP